MLCIKSNMNQTIYIEVGTKKYPLIITPCIDKEDIEAWAVHIRCDIIWLNQGYLREDLHLLIEDLPDMITDILSEKKDTNIPIRFSSTEKLKIEQKAKANGYKNISSYIRAKALN